MEKNMVLVETENGLMAEIPEEKLEAWKRGQEKLKNKEPEAIKRAEQLQSEILSKLRGPRR